MSRTKKTLGQKFLQSLHTLQSPLTVSTTPPPSTRQWSGRHARERIRCEGAHDKRSTSLDAATAISLFSPGVKGAYVNRDGCCFAGKWQDVGERKGINIMNHMIDAVHHVAKAFCPTDSHGLVQTVLRSGAAETSNPQSNFHQWKKTRLVQLLFKEYINAKTCFR